MALKNRQGGKVEIFVGADRLSSYAKNVIEFDELALKTDVATAITKASLLTALGVPGPFVNDAAAATGGIAVGGLYYVTTTLKLQVRVA